MTRPGNLITYILGGLALVYGILLLIGGILALINLIPTWAYAIATGLGLIIGALVYLAEDPNDPYVADEPPEVIAEELRRRGLHAVPDEEVPWTPHDPFTAPYPTTTEGESDDDA